MKERKLLVTYQQVAFWAGCHLTQSHDNILFPAPLVNDRKRKWQL